MNDYHFAEVDKYFARFIFDVQVAPDVVLNNRAFDEWVGLERRCCGVA